MSFRHGIARSIGSFVGLFAIVMATLLAPVHQAHAVQRDLAQASGDVLGAHIICHGDPSWDADGAGDSGSTNDTGSAVRCPVCSLAKQVGAAPSPVMVAAPAVWIARVAVPLAVVEVRTSDPDNVAQPRGPPIPV